MSPSLAGIRTGRQSRLLERRVQANTTDGATRRRDRFGLKLSLPLLPSFDVFSAILAVAAAVAIFRFKVGMITTLLACSAVGILLHLVGLVA